MGDKGEFLDDWDAVRARARGALDRAAQPALFDRLDWLEPLHRHCFADRPLLAVRGETADAGAWLFLTRAAPGRLEALANWHSFATGPILAGAPDDRAATAMLAAMARRLRGQAWHLRLYPLVEDDPRRALLARALRAGGWLVVQRPMGRNHVLTLAPDTDFAAYWADRPGELRATVARKNARAPLDIRIEDRFTADIWADYEAVFAQSWQAGAGQAVLRALAEREGAAGTLRLGLAYRDGAPVAAALWTVENGTALIHKHGYAETAADISPGTRLTRALFAHVIDRDGARTIDFGTGTLPSKGLWMPRDRALIQLDAFDPRRAAAWAPALRAGISALVPVKASR
jgi:hypothetical protein